jgi:GT2 family glycosyltransferase
MIYSFTPYSTEKNFGKAINDHCRLVTDPEAWICIRDGDICNLTPDWGMIMHKYVNLYGSEYALFGCWTNRLNKGNGSHQLVKGMYEEFDIRKHYEKALEMDSGIVSVKSVAGFFMLFQKKTFDLVGGFKENTTSFDTDFCRKVRKSGGKIGLINRLYVFHLYRIWAKGDPGIDTKHLNKNRKWEYYREN